MLLSSSDHDRIDAVVAACEAARGLQDLRERVLDGLATWLDFRRTTFFVAPTFREVFDDPEPVTHGLPVHVPATYHEVFRHTDPFRQIAAGGSARRVGPISLDQLHPLQQISHKEYVTRFLVRNDIRAKVVIPVQGTGGTAGIGLLAPESGAFGARDLAMARRLALRLSAHYRLWSGVADPAGLDCLTRREREICEKVATGLGDHEIALDLRISPNTVKSHLKRAYEKLGVANRVKLAERLSGLRFTR